MVADDVYSILCIYVYCFIYIYIYVYTHIYIYICTYISRTKVSELFSSAGKEWMPSAEDENRGCEMRT